MAYMGMDFIVDGVIVFGNQTIFQKHESET
jgi:hypothetical protein